MALLPLELEWLLTAPLDYRCSLKGRSLIREASGIYGWFFRGLSAAVPLADCLTDGDLTILYVEISPKRPSEEGRASGQTLPSRIRYHYRVNAEGSTLRLTLGCVLSALGIELRRVGSGYRMTFRWDGEQKLSAWLAENAFVRRTQAPAPWDVEHLAALETSTAIKGTRSTTICVSCARSAEEKP